MKVVAGTEVQEEKELPVWEDSNGVERVLMAVLSNKANIENVVISVDHLSGGVSCFSNTNDPLVALGLLERGKHIIHKSMDE
jgi:hypothetical protein